MSGFGKPPHQRLTPTSAPRPFEHARLRFSRAWALHGVSASQERAMDAISPFGTTWNSLSRRTMSTSSEAVPAAAAAGAASASEAAAGAAGAGSSAPPPKPPGAFSRFYSRYEAWTTKWKPGRFLRFAFFALIAARIAQAQYKQREFLRVKEGTIVRWRLDKLAIDEQPPQSGFREALARSNPISGMSERFISLIDFLQAIRDIETDERVTGLVLDLASAGQFSARGGIGFAQAQEIREALLNLRRAKSEQLGEGNFLMVACTDTFESQLGYYLASVFDEIRAEPMAGLPLFGFGSTQPFFRNLLDRLKIQVRTFTREQYKSVLSNVQGTGYSPDIKANTMSLLKSLNDQFIEGIAQGRAGRLRMLDTAKTFGEIDKGNVTERGEVETSELYALAGVPTAGMSEQVLEAIKAAVAQSGGETALRPRSIIKDGPITPVGAAFFPAHAFLTEDEMEESVGFVRKLIDRGPLTAKEALKAGLVDALKYRRDIVDWFLGDVWEGQVRSKAIESMGAPSFLGGLIWPSWGQKKKHVESMSIFRYKVARDYELQRKKQRWFPNPLIPVKAAAPGTEQQFTRYNANRMVVGVVYLTGGINRGDGPGGANYVVKGMSEAARDQDVEAIVLRIDSGGGDALASDTIWEAVKNVREATGKPVIASMGNMCASGGYYAASAADKIIAMPGTITGSIGVASMRPWLTPDFLDKFGVTTDDVHTTNSARVASVFHDLDAKELAKTERNIESMYRVFRKRVADGRKWSSLPEEECEKKLNAVTGGRVFSGEQAKENGLVDELGGMNHAIYSAVELALLHRTHLLPEKIRDVVNELATPPEPEQVDIRVYPVERSWLSFLSGDNESIEENLLSLGKVAAGTVAGWFTAGNGLMELEKALLDAGEREQQKTMAGRGQMEADLRLTL